MSKTVGKQSVLFENPPFINAASSIVGQKEGEGPLRKFFDLIVEDPTYGKDSWEESESEFVFQACKMAIRKANLDTSNIRYVFAGDLLANSIASTFGVKKLDIPLFGIYGACSTIGEAMSLAAMTIDGGYGEHALAVASSHFASAEKQFRFPLEYGNQRPLAATWTVTGSGAVIISKKVGTVQIKGITTGKIVDYGIKDTFNMGACMAPAAANVIYQNLKDFNIEPDYYDKIITGDLGMVGQEILIKLLKDNGYDISDRHMDCGIEIYDGESQDTHSGGSGCGCAAVTFAGMIIRKLKEKKYKRVLFLPTGALLSTVSHNEEQTIPGIAHGLILENL